MLNSLFRFIHQVVAGMRPWVTIYPWSVGVRVRLGKHAKQIGPGIRLRIPFVDTVFIVNTRLRTITTERQTITSLDGKAYTIRLNIVFCVRDALQMFRTLHQPAETIADLASSEAAQFVAASEGYNVSPHSIAVTVGAALNLEQYGCECSRALVSEFADVKTYRLLGDGDNRIPYIAMNTPSVGPTIED